MTIKDCTKEFNRTKQYFAKIAKNDALHQKLLLATKDGLNLDRSHLRLSKWHEVEVRLVEYVQKIRRMQLDVHVPITGALLQSTATTIATRLHITDFKASNGWLQKFLKRWAISSTSLHGEAASCDPEAIAQAMLDLKIEFQQYDVHHIFNYDETALFYHMMPKRTYIAPEEQANMCTNKRQLRGRKDLKDRVTLGVAVNASGTVRVPVTMIGRPAQPRIFKTEECPIPYMSQKSVWMTRDLMKRWVDNVFTPAVRKKLSGPILLVVDNFSGHMSVKSDAEACGKASMMIDVMCTLPT